LWNGKPSTLLIPEEFHDYMDKYIGEVRYITDAGTPWLTRAEESDPAYAQQRADYFDALKSGQNTDVVMIHWRSTNAKRKDTGHTAISVGQLRLIPSEDGQD